MCTNVELDTVAAGLPDAGTAYAMFNDLPRISDAWRFGIWSEGVTRARVRAAPG